MATTPAVQEKVNPGTYKERVGRNVLKKFGYPSNYVRIDVCPTYSDYYRVNLWTLVKRPGDTQKSNHLTHSWLVRADENGNILDSRPTITQKYPPKLSFPAEECTITFTEIPVTQQGCCDETPRSARAGTRDSSGNDKTVRSVDPEPSI
jgi:hypothetical protein